MKVTLRKGRKAGTWELRVSLGRDPLTGKYGQLSRTFEGRRGDAQIALAELIIEISRDSYTGAAGNALVNDLLAVLHVLEEPYQHLGHMELAADALLGDR